MAFSGDPHTLLNAIEWTELAIPLKDFTGKHPVPNIVKVTKGQYRNVGVAKSVHSELYLHSVRTTKKVLAESVKIKPGKGPTVSEQKYSLPITYQGWFELLSEDGKAIKALQSVQELVKVFPQSCLVRENIKAYVPRENGDLAPDRVRVVIAGEMLTLVAEMFMNFPGQKSHTKRRLLRCIDQKGESIYFAYDQKGLFSPVAGQANISGVHSIKGLLEKFRLPILVRLVHGTIPSKIEKTFTGTFRLISIYSDEMAFVSPLRKDAKMVPISTREPLKVVATNNFDTIREMEECKYIQQKCNTMISSYLNSIHILFAMPDPSILERGKEDIKKILKTHSKAPGVPATSITEAEEEEIFEQIDGIYQYVRDGVMPAQQKSKKKGLAPAPPGQSHSPSAPSTPYVSSGKLNSVKKKSPGQEAVDMRNNHDDDKDYWEEPIYEPIEKIRRSKRDSVDDALGEDEAKLDFETETSTIVHEPAHTPITGQANNPVQNLRAVMKSRPSSSVYTPNMPSGLVKEAIETIETNYDVLPPPVPPKKYDPTDIASISPTTTVIRSNSKSPHMPNNLNVNISAGDSKKRGVSSPGPATSPFTPTANTTRVSVMPKNSKVPNGNGTTHPPYVAVARVEGSYSNGGVPIANKPEKSLFGNLRRKLGMQSYL